MTAMPVPYSYRSHGSTDRTEDRKRVPARARSAEIQAAVDDWNSNNPTIATPFGQENLARGTNLQFFGSVDVMRGGVIDESGNDYTFEQMWVDRFTHDPDLMWLIIGDIVRYVSADEIPRGDRTSSRRQVQDRDKNLDAVWRIIGPRYSMEPFPVAIRELIGERSLRAFAIRAGFGSPETLRRYMSGKRPLSMEAMEAMAKAGRVEPHFFVEYRAMWIARELMRAMLARPIESLRAIQKVRAAVV